MNYMPKQLLLPIKYECVYSEENFIVSECNSCAYGWLKFWPYHGANNFTCIVGDRSSGKTHLANIWANNNGAMLIPTKQFAFDEFYDIVVGSGLGMFVIDNIDEIADDIFLFCLYNLVKERNLYVLATASKEPHMWDIKLQDTVSRIATIHIERITNPCDAIESVVSKMLENNGIEACSNIVRYISNNIERSYEAINRLIIMINKFLPERKKFSMGFIKDIVGLL